MVARAIAGGVPHDVFAGAVTGIVTQAAGLLAATCAATRASGLLVKDGAFNAFVTVGAVFDLRVQEPPLLRSDLGLVVLSGSLSKYWLTASFAEALTSIFVNIRVLRSACAHVPVC